ncbi:Rho GTPase activation protein, partial [Eremomyces bilateralis CBS 781.70]
RAGKFFNKLARSGSSHEREVDAAQGYVCRVINMPLIEQTRVTRISKRLEGSKDKTEFWMPALPWRCIDYLNMNGCEQEGLYRIPGSGREVKQWQMRFDQEYDIDLFSDPDLYDINTITSLFKAWLRDLPDEVFPKP